MGGSSFGGLRSKAPQFRTRFVVNVQGRAKSDLDRADDVGHTMRTRRSPTAGFAHAHTLVQASQTSRWRQIVTREG